jgi:hypothetical protein
LMGGGNKDEEELAAVSFPFIFLSKFYPSWHLGIWAECEGAHKEVQKMKREAKMEETGKAQKVQEELWERVWGDSS